MMFCGALFDVHPRYQHVKSLLMDFFRGQVVDKMEIDGLQHVICLTVPEQVDSDDLPPITFRVYLIQSRKVPGSKVPKVELEEMGPRMDLKLGRWKEASEDVMKLALKKPKETAVFFSLCDVAYSRSRRRRTLRLILWEINLDEFMSVFKI
jgi:ribosome production factor 2